MYQSNTCRKDLSWLHFREEPRVQERQQGRCFIPSLLVEFPDVSETPFNRLLENMVSTRQLPESYAEEAKQEFLKFLSMVKERRENFIEFDVTAEY